MLNPDGSTVDQAPPPPTQPYAPTLGGRPPPPPYVEKGLDAFLSRSAPSLDTKLNTSNYNVKKARSFLLGPKPEKKQRNGTANVKLKRA